MAGTFFDSVPYDGALGSISGVTSVLPGGAALGTPRYHASKLYRLFCNASNQEAAKGQGMNRNRGSATGGVGPYSLTVTTVTESVNNTVCAVEHATVPSGHYFWGVTYGHPVSLLMSNVSVATGAYVTPAAGGKFNKTDTASHYVAVNQGDAASSTGTTDAVSGRFFVFFEQTNFNLDQISSDEGGLAGISGVTGTLPDGMFLGMQRNVGNKRYQLFYNTSNQSAAIGTGMQRSGGSAAGGAGPYSLTVTTVTEAVNNTVCAVEHNSVPTANYFWGVTFGHPVALKMSNVSVATDGYITPAADGKFTLTTTVSHYVAQNKGDAALSTGTTDTVSGRFFVFFETSAYRFDV